MEEILEKFIPKMETVGSTWTGISRFPSNYFGKAKNHGITAY